VWLEVAGGYGTHAMGDVNDEINGINAGPIYALDGSPYSVD
jgi:hypothetical protein